MYIPLNDLSRVSDSQVENELNLVKRVLQSGHYLKSTFTLEFTNLIGNKIGIPHVLAVGNGTDALRIAMSSLGLQAGDLIATVPNAGGYATGVAKSLGLRVGMVDVDATNLQMSPESLSEFIELYPEVKAVVLTHLYGQIGFATEIASICHKNKIFLIEDCAQSFGAKKDGVSAGAFGDVSTFSFYPTKNLGAAGDGGAVAFKDKKHFEIGTSLSQYGWSERYKVELSNGLNTRMDEIQAAILVSRLKKLDDENRIRRRNIQRFKQNSPANMVVLGSSDESFIGHLAVVISESKVDHIEYLNNQGIETGVHYPILDFEQPAWIDEILPSKTPVANYFVKRIFTLPNFPGLRENEIQFICECLSSLEKYAK